MSIRITLLVLLVIFLSGYAWKNWFVSLCGAVVLMAVVQHPDFPNSIGGIQGMNLWNILLLSIIFAWLMRPREAGYTWDLPPKATWMLIGYLLVIVVGDLRLILHPKRPADYTLGNIISEDFINCVKWVLPSLLLFDACRTRKRITIALVTILALYVLLAIQVIRWMPLSAAASGADISARASKIIQNEIGYNRVTMSMMLAGASWAVLASVILVSKRSHILGILLAAGVVAMGQALTGGRTGYLTWGVVGMVLSAVRWPRLLGVIPVAIFVLVTAVPGVQERMLQGFGGKKGNFRVEADAYEMTSGRNIAWPMVIHAIAKSPITGAGREGMVTTGIKDALWEGYYESFPHPHQAYLEILLDNGIIGFLLVIPFYFYALGLSFQLLRERSDPLVTVVGCTAFCLILSLLIGSFGGQTFYPREGSVGMWAAIGLMMRVSVDYRRSLETGEPMFEEDWETPGDPYESYLRHPV